MNTESIDVEAEKIIIQKSQTLFQEIISLFQNQINNKYVIPQKVTTIQELQNAANNLKNKEREYQVLQQANDFMSGWFMQMLNSLQKIEDYNNLDLSLNNVPFKKAASIAKKYTSGINNINRFKNKLIIYNQLITKINQGLLPITKEKTLNQPSVLKMEIPQIAIGNLIPLTIPNNNRVAQINDNIIDLFNQRIDNERQNASSDETMSETTERTHTTDTDDQSTSGSSSVVPMDLGKKKITFYYTPIVLQQKQPFDHYKSVLEDTLRELTFSETINKLYLYDPQLSVMENIVFLFLITGKNEEFNPTTIEYSEKIIAIDVTANNKSKLAEAILIKFKIKILNEIMRLIILNILNGRFTTTKPLSLNFIHTLFTTPLIRQDNNKLPEDIANYMNIFEISTETWALSQKMQTTISINTFEFEKYVHTSKDYINNMVKVLKDWVWPVTIEVE